MPADTRPHREITITRIINAPPALVFQMWTDPQHLARWFGPHHFTIPECRIDPRIGGELYIVMRGFGNDHPMKGVFQEFDPPHRLSFTNIALDAAGNHLLEGLTTVTFKNVNGKTKLTLQTSATGLVPAAPQMLAGMEIGWTQSLEKLDTAIVAL